MATAAVKIRFGTSGWRAVIADEFTFDNSRRAVKAIGLHLRSVSASGPVLIAHDTRFMAREFAREAAWELEEMGFDARLAAHPVPTPVLAFAIRQLGAAGGLNFTASHNPPKYLGLKFSGADGAPALPEVTSDIESRITEDPGEAAAAREVASYDPRPAYLAALRRLVDPGELEAASLALDFRFGTSAGYLDGFFEGTAMDLHRLHERPDPLFGGQSPQCSETELARLSGLVTSRKCRLGLATDGDADRFGVLDERGAYVTPNRILALVAWDVFSKTGSRKGIARSVATTQALDAVAKHFGVELFETPVGFKYIGKLLLDGKIAFGGEESAGLTVESHVPDKDGILADVLVCRAVLSRGGTLSDRLASLERAIGPFSSGRLDLRLSEDARRKLAEARRTPPDRFAGDLVRGVDATDGVKLNLNPPSWVLFRESGTEPVVRVYAESRSPRQVQTLLQAGESFLEG